VGLGGQYRRVCGPDVRHVGPCLAVVPSNREENGMKRMNSQLSYIAGTQDAVRIQIPENDIENDVRILIDLLQFKGHVLDANLSSFALGQRRCSNAYGKRELFVVQTDVLWNRGQQLDLGDNLCGDRVGVVFRTQCFRVRGDRKEGRNLRGGAGQREREAVQRDPALLRVDDFGLGRERGAEGGDPRRAGEGRLLHVRVLRRGVEVVLRARIALPTVPVLVARGKPARDEKIEGDVPRAVLFSVLVALVAELDGRFRDEFFGDGAETDGRIARLLHDQLCLSFESDDERSEEDAGGAPSFKAGFRGGQGEHYVTGEGVGRSTIAYAW